MMLIDMCNNDNSGNAAYLANERTVNMLLHSFTELGSGQLQLLCELHPEELVQWLGEDGPGVDVEERMLRAIANANGGTQVMLDALPESPLSSPKGGVSSPNGGGSVNSGSGNSGSGGSSSGSGCDSGIAILRHIGRVDPGMLFLASLADDIIGRLARSRRPQQAQQRSQNQTVAQSLAQNFPQQWQHPPQNLPTPSGGMNGMPTPSPFMLAPHDLSHVQPIMTDHARRSLEGTWELGERADYDQFDQFLTAIGYPWFLRQFLGPAMSCQKIVYSEAGQRPLHESHVDSCMPDNTPKETTIVIAACGKFLGYTLENINKRLPPMVFQCSPPNTIQPKYQLVHRPPATSCVGKLSYRFVNTHTTVSNMDGSCACEYINYNPKHFFSGTITTVFDFEDMKHWIAHLHDADPTTGLPKTMVREHWDRRVITANKVQPREGPPYMHWKCYVYEYDSGTNEWDRVCCEVAVNYIRKP
jgi:hypothetical protein